MSEYFRLAAKCDGGARIQAASPAFRLLFRRYATDYASGSQGFRELTGSLNPFFVDGNVVYNWEDGVWHPFATGGLGMYRFGYSQIRGQAEVTGSDTNLGVDFGGGIEYFFAPRATIVGEGLFHQVGDVATPGALFHTGGGSFFSVTDGVKKYF